MKQEGPGRRVRFYIGENDQWHGRPLYTAIVQEARKRGMAGATVARGIMGYGAHSAIHEPHLFSLSHDLPVVAEIVDTDEKVRQFLPRLHTLRYRSQVLPAAERLLYQPLVAITLQVADAVRRPQSGYLSAYIAYIPSVLLMALIVLTHSV
jgi:uncharacterized protein